MRMRLAVLGLLVLGTTVPARADAPLGPDWVSIHLTAGPEGASGVVIAVGAHAVTVGSDTQLLGLGFGGAAFPGGCNLVFALGGGETAVSTTKRDRGLYHEDGRWRRGHGGRRPIRG